LANLKYRFLKAEDREQLSAIFTAENGQLPEGPTFTAIVAEDPEGKIVGFWGLELMAHAGPLWIHPDYRGTGIWRKLHAALNLIFRGSPKNHGYYVFSKSPKTDHMFRALGLEETGMKVFRKAF